VTPGVIAGNSLRLFTSGPVLWAGGVCRFPRAAIGFPSKDEMANYLELYAATFDLRLLKYQSRIPLERRAIFLSRTAGARRFQAENVIRRHVGLSGAFHTCLPQIG